MSSENQSLNSGNQATTNYDLSKIFIWNNRYHKGQYTNIVYDPEILLPGQLIGRVATTNKLVKCFSTSTDGSQYPIGVVADNYTIEEGATKEISICTAGDIVKDKIIYEGSDGPQTVVSGRTQTIADLLQAAGLNLVDNNEMTDYDNQ